MPIVLPEIPAGILTLLSFFAPYAIAAINHPSWKSGSKRLVAIVFSIILTLVVIVFYYLMTGDTIQSWPIMILLGLIVSQAAFTLLWKSAKNIEGKHGTK